MPFSLLLILALGFTSIANAQHGHHGKPFPKLNPHRAPLNPLYPRGPNETGTVAPSATPTGSLPTSSPSCSYWLEDIEHQGYSPFHVNPGPEPYQVFRNVKDYGAIGDGITDDTIAINTAISSGNRCAPGSCQSSTTAPAIVYFPPGTYLVSNSIVDFYETQLIGNPNCLPIIKASSDFVIPNPANPPPVFVIDSDPYFPGGVQGYGSTNVFYRQVRNFVVDMTSVAPEKDIRGIHWPTAQATSLQNLVFRMSEAPGTRHQGVFIENGSGGFVNDLVFFGGLYGANWGNQQFTMRNLTFNNAVTAINQIWSWGWTYKSITINNCTIGLDMSSIDPKTNRPSVGSITLIDSSFNEGIVTARGPDVLPPTVGSLILENVNFNNVPNALSESGTTAVSRVATLAGYGAGHAYTPNGPEDIDGELPGFSRPANLLQSDGKYYERSKPQYAHLPSEMFYSVRNAGAFGDGIADDTATLQHVINLANFFKKIVFFDFGVYRVTRTLRIPPGSRIVGESYPVIISSGRFFANMRRPQPVVQVGRPGDKGLIEWSDMIVSTQGNQAGAVLIEINLESTSGSPTGLWDVHTRIGGFAGSNLQQDDCAKTPNVATPPARVNQLCVAAFMGMHITKEAAAIYLENVWIWTADHDLDNPTNQNATSTQITIYTGRGLLVESKDGPIWLVGTAVEHFALYQYQFVNTKDVFAGQIQTETAYYQPNPDATVPFPPVASLHDPIFTKGQEGWGLRVVNSEDVFIYGAGLYSFFINYNNTCAPPTDNLYCQSRIFSIEGTCSNVNIYNLNTVGASSMIDRDGISIASGADNVNVYPDTIALFTSG